MEEKLKKLDSIIIKNNSNYFNSGENDLNDEVFDSVVEYRNKFSEEKLVLNGAQSEENTEMLVYPMPSLDKITFEKNHEKELRKFCDKNRSPYIITDKVDGTSIQIIYKSNKIKILTKGDGVKGKDVSFLLDHLDIPRYSEDIVVRAELTISKSDYQEIVPILRSRGNKALNSRNFVNGIVNSKEIDSSLVSKCIVIALGIYSSTDSPSFQFNKLKRLGFRIPDPVLYNDIRNEQDFTDVLLEETTIRRNEALYTIDGVVIASDTDYRQITENVSPEHMIAFKKNSCACTTVIKVEWNITKYGYFEPLIYYEQTEILGNNYRTAHGINAKFIEENGIGPGALVVLTICGDLKPQITEVLEKVEPQFPEEAYIWNKTRVRIMVENIDNYPESQILKMESFLKILGAKHCGQKTLERMYDNGINTIEKLIRVRVSDLENIDRMGTKSATRIIDEMQESIRKASWPKIMAASGAFSEAIGVQRCEKFVESFPDFRYQNITKEDIMQIHGFGEVLSEKMYEGLSNFLSWIARNPMCVPRVVEKSRKNKSLQGEVIVFTGLTAPGVLEQEINERGGIVKDNFTKATTILVKKDENFKSSKTKSAEERKITIYTYAQFCTLPELND